MQRKHFVAAATLVLCACGSSGGGSGITGTSPAPSTLAQATGLIGQPNYASGSINAGGSPSASSLNLPSGSIATDGQSVFYLADTANNRILGYTFVPTSVAGGIAGPAEFVIGQQDFTQTIAASGPTALAQPESPWLSSDGKLLVADSANNRVLVWLTAPKGNVRADLVIGQPDYVGNSSNEGSAMPGNLTLSNPSSAVLAGNKLFIADSNNNRVLIWNDFNALVAAASAASGGGSVNTTPADIELGQAATQTTTSIGPGGTPMSSTQTCTTSSGATGFCFTTDAPGIDQFIAGTTNHFILAMNHPTGQWSDGVRLYVADTNNNRVLVWNSIPGTNDQLADFVVGQPAFAEGAIGTGSGGLDNPKSIYSDATHLLVADTGNNRVLVFSDVPIQQNGLAASGVFGQEDFTHVTANDPDQNGVIGDQSVAGDPLTPTAGTLNNPDGVTVLGDGSVFVSDEDNHRVLKFPLSAAVNGSQLNQQ